MIGEMAAAWTATGRTSADPATGDGTETRPGVPAGRLLRPGVPPRRQAIARLHERARHRRVPVVGITGTGGAGKSASPTSSSAACAWTRATACASP